MKMAFMNVLVGLAFAASPLYAQTGMRGNSTGSPTVGYGNAGSFVEHNPPILFHGETVPRIPSPVQGKTGEPRGSGQPGIVGDRALGTRRVSGSHGDFGDRHIFRGGLFGHGRGVVIFAYGVPYYYPVYYPDSGSYDSAPGYAPDSAPEYPADPGTQMEQSTNPDTDSFYQPGYQWGGEMKLYHVTMDQFVTYLKTYILTASPVQQAAFRSGFVAHFGADGQGIYDQAVQQSIPQN